MKPQHVRRRMLALCPGLLLLLGAPGCIATRDWVKQQVTPVEGRVATVEARLGQADTKADKAHDRLDHLQLERRVALTFKEGAHFGRGSDALTAEGRRAIDRFLSSLNGNATDNAIFLVAGHTDSTGADSYNYELGQRRAASVARYLISRKGIDPLRVTVASYGANAPLADNATGTGRQKNRRVEILVYREGINTSGSQQLELQRESQQRPTTLASGK